jgi:hypothetical protein
MKNYAAMGNGAGPAFVAASAPGVQNIDYLWLFAVSTLLL